MPDVKPAVWFGRKTCAYIAKTPVCEVFFYKIADKIAGFYIFFRIVHAKIMTKLPLAVNAAPPARSAGGVFGLSGQAAGVAQKKR
jgi:hypothetical protein